MDAASRVARIGLVLADAEFDSEANHLHIRRHLRALSVIPAKRGRSSRRGFRGQMRRDFSRRLYRQLAKAETLFSVANVSSRPALRVAACARKCARLCYSAWPSTFID